MGAMPLFTGALFFLFLFLPATSMVVRPAALNLTSAPYVDFTAPKHGQCFPSGMDVTMMWTVVFSVGREEGEAFLARHAATAEVCFAVGSDGTPQCMPMAGISSEMVIAGLGDGCHTLAAWWQDKHALRRDYHPRWYDRPKGGTRSDDQGISGAAMSVAVAVGRACEEGCSLQPGSTAGAFAAPPNSVTGGCIKGGPSTSSAGGDGRCSRRCAEGCCEATTPFSLCVHGQSAAAANATHADVSVSPPLPFCSECLAEVAPPQLELLPRFGDPAGLTQRYLRLVRETVLHSAFEGPMETQDFDSLSALTMVGRRRIDHLSALVQDVLHRDVPGDIIELGSWRGGVALFAAAALTAYEATKPPLWWQRMAAEEAAAAAAAAASRGGGSGSGGSGGGGGGGGPWGAPVGFDGAARWHPRRKRLVWLADSFDGLPPVDLDKFPGDASHEDTSDTSQGHLDILRANSVEMVSRAAEALDVREGVRFLKGFFNDTLPAAIRDGTFRDDGGGGGVGDHSGGDQRDVFSILRLDGDLYQSTLESLHYLYPLLSVGGHVIVDDFTDWEGCRQAVADFRAAHGIGGGSSAEPGSLSEDLQVTWHDLRTDPARKEFTRGVWWTKRRDVAYDPLDADRPVFYAPGGAVRLPPPSL